MVQSSRHLTVLRVVGLGLIGIEGRDVDAGVRDGDASSVQGVNSLIAASGKKQSYQGEHLAHALSMRGCGIGHHQTRNAGHAHKSIDAASSRGFSLQGTHRLTALIASPDRDSQSLSGCVGGQPARASVHRVPCPVDVFD